MVVLAFNPRDVGFKQAGQMTMPVPITIAEARRLLSGKVYHCMGKEYAQAAERLLHKRLGIAVELLEIEGKLFPPLRRYSRIVIPHITGIRKNVDCEDFTASEIRKARIQDFRLCIYHGGLSAPVGGS